MAKKAKAVKKKGKDQPFLSRWRVVPLKSSFMATAILGFFISAYWVFPQSRNYGIAFMLIFVLMFISSFVSMERAPVRGMK
tara:strand:- start:223 stop:465 length:243 start_codon:yes stop_codon:yes gene_type:complete